MGATTFYTIGKAADAKTAFIEAREQYMDYSEECEGYSGTIAEKSSYRMIELDVALLEDNAGKTWNSKMYSVLDDLLMHDERINNKYKPCGCVKLREGEYLFFGWAAE